MPITLVIADDHAVIRYGLATILAEPAMQIVGEASNGLQAVEQTVKHKPDILLLDVRMPQCDGISCLEEVKRRQPETRVIMYSGYDNPTYVARSIIGGASDYVLKANSQDDLLATINRVVAGEPADGSSLFHRIKQLLAQQETLQEAPELTRRETQVAVHMGLGLSNREIGRSLGISIETVKEHVQNILRKLNKNDRTALAVWAVRTGLVP